jgi:type II secretory ATPase GspE/PulE/Tfp pilus assembly ATPase PilB-like protein
MSGVGGETNDAPVEGQISFNYHGQRVDIRINILKTVIGYDFNMRFIDSSLRGLEELGLSEKNYKQYVDLLHMTKGMVILCGPTGSGKTTLLYAGFKKLLTENKAIFTIEDPVEIVLPGTTQVSVKKEKGMSYAERFPSSLRHDPDIIAIGETRTLDVAEQAVQAANTGHLVFTTLHTNDAVGAISRLTNLGLAPYAIGDVLAAVVAQRLVRRVCPKCKELYDLPEDHEWRQTFDLGDGPIKLARGKGCEYCAGSGYRGRVGVNEFMICSPKLRDAIQKNKTRIELESILHDEGYRTYLEDAKEKALEGVTTFDEVNELYQDIL